MSNAIGSSRESKPSRRICHLRAVPPGHVADIKLNCSGSSHLQYALQRLLQAYFQFKTLVYVRHGQNTAYFMRPAGTYILYHFMRPAVTYRSITPTVNQAEDLFLALPTSAALILAVVDVLNTIYPIITVHAKDFIISHNNGPPTRKVAHPWLI